MKGWRRKAGCIALLVAMPFLTLWIRCNRVCDWIRIGPLEAVSEEGTLSFEFTEPRWPNPLWRSFPNERHVTFFTHTEMAIPYWCIVVPLAVISGYLILLKPISIDAGDTGTPPACARRA